MDIRVLRDRAADSAHAPLGNHSELQHGKEPDTAVVMRVQAHGKHGIPGVELLFRQFFKQPGKRLFIPRVISEHRYAA